MAIADQSLRPLLAALAQTGRLATVHRPVDPSRDLAAVAALAHRRLAKATRFAQPAAPLAWPVIAGLLAGRAPWSLALGLPEDQLIHLIGQRLGRPMPISEIPVEAAPIMRRRQDAAQIDLAALPAPLCAARDAGRQFAALAIARDPDSGSEHLGWARLKLLDAAHAGIAEMTPALERFYENERRQGRALPIALVLGAAPALILAAAMGSWRSADLSLAGAIAMESIRAVTLHDLPVPADAEIALLGCISAEERADLGCLANSLGLYGEARRRPVFTLDRIAHRDEPIFHALFLAGNDDLSGALSLAAESLIAEHLRNIEGGIDFSDIRCPPAAGGLAVIIKLRGRVEGQVKTALLGALSGAVNWPKLAIAVDEDVDPGDLRDVFWSVASRTHAQIDVGMIDGARAHPQDPASIDDGITGARTGTRWFIDSSMPPLSQPQRRESFARAVPKNLRQTDLSAFLSKG